MGNKEMSKEGKVRRLLGSYALFAMPTPLLLACLLAASGHWLAAIFAWAFAEAVGLFALCVACGPAAISRIKDDGCDA